MSHQDGRCAAESETVYVEKKQPGCANSLASDAGTASRPYCSIDLAPKALTAVRRVIVVKGIVSGIFSWSAGVGDGPVSLIGQQDAAFGAGLTSDPGAYVAGGDLYVRQVTVAGGAGVGIAAGTGAIIRLDRVMVRDNKQGGLRAAGDGYDVTNSVFMGNGGQLDDTRAYSGAYLGSGPLTAPHRFTFNTVVATKASAVVCPGSFGGATLTASLLAGNEPLGCQLVDSKTSSDGEPALAADGWHLTAASTCRNAVAAAPANAPPTDIDGDARPLEGKYDCGADEFKP